ncbi:MAG: phosphonopyruvate decarboxylase [Pseudolabrys sp.]|nr:phosphonopyruvate decarboxylase [Pseudolabrys sp.]
MERGSEQGRPRKELECSSHRKSGANVSTETPARTWPREIYDVLKQVGIEQVAYVPDAGHAQLIRDCEADNAMNVVSLTTEEEGVAMLAGGWLGGKKGVLLMQSSGVGNCINMLSVAIEGRFPLLMIVTMRGEWGEFNSWQLPMGQSTPKVLEDIGVYVQRAERADEVRDVVFAAAQMTFSSNRPIAVLLGQRLLGFKDWSK